ncbi:tRNA-(ms[2]io[6]A)-hydroxylase [Acinetobacter larvae]|uniref:tRNA-(Ms[2]io[6]A)-hydroxylase n=1 Tax=Acinetobacter larvae TaxID=1789224 RepID=A0A1B2M1G5_9GAMM|nr:tRNA-(ms[2]io[6]A)-hydroxylase [Acinetobacter larvae]AOA59028.1 tRNA-(ms[2]io[6]A)-hydroxylase [Acinetobacter larvae]
MSKVDYAQLMQPVKDFLGCETPQAWLMHAVEHIDILMQDHANCEKKAAGTAMNLMFRYSFFTDLQVKLAQLVREEMLHYEQVLELMEKRGQAWQALSAGRYAAGLRKEIRTYEPEALVDVLIIGAFVEARSCERFYALSDLVDDELAKYYRYLLKSESRHFEDYLALAADVARSSKMKDPTEDIQQRIAHIRQVEAELIESPDPLFRFHSGVPSAPALASSNEKSIA